MGKLGERSSFSYNLIYSTMKEDHSSTLVNKLRQIVLDNLKNEQFGVEDLAREYGLSRSQLHKRLKKSIGKSVSQFIREVRLEEALKLMKDKELTVSEVAYEVGFSSPTYFSTCFKEYFGYSPGETKIRNKVGDLEGSLQDNTSDVNSTGKRTFLYYLFGIFTVIALSYTIVTMNKDADQIQKEKEGLLLGEDDNIKAKSIAVLPLRNWSGDANLEYICDGTTDAIINKLASIQAIDKVIPYTSVIKYKSADKSIKEIAAELGVRNIIQGSFQLSGSEVSIKLQMIDGESERQFWNKEFSESWESDELFKLQTRVAENISYSIGAQITEMEESTLNTIPTSNKVAYDLYLQGNYEWSKGTRLGFDNAIRLFEEAIKADSTFVEAYVNLSNVWKLGSGVWGYYDAAEANSKANGYIMRAKRIAPENEKVLDLFLRIALFDEWDFATLEENYQKTLIAPLYLMYVGRYEEAEAYMNDANQLRNANKPLYSYWSAEALFYNDRKEKALEIYKNDYTLYNDNYDWLRESVKYLYYLGEYEMSRERLDRLMQIFPDRPPIVIWLDAVLSESQGKKKKATEQLEKLKEVDNNTSSGSPAWFIALYYCHVMDYETAFNWLEKSFNKREGEIIWLHSEPLLKPLREDDRYLKLHRKIGFPLAPLE